MKVTDITVHDLEMLAELYQDAWCAEGEFGVDCTPERDWVDAITSMVSQEVRLAYEAKRADRVKS